MPRSAQTTAHERARLNEAAAVASAGTASAGTLHGAAGSGPRLAFVGAGWIGRHRMESLVRGRLARPVLIAEPDATAAAAAQALAPDATLVADFDEVLERAAALDGIVIATPSALHAVQSLAALERGLAVFCQKPLGLDGAEVSRIVGAARAADRLLHVDMCYRFTHAARAVHELVAGGALGRIYAVDLTFHNAYGPDKAWFYDRARSGGGCLVDLGIHLADLLLWMLDFPEIEDAAARMFAGGERLRGRARVEDHAIATLHLEGEVTARLACSWNLHAGRDAEISAVFHGTEGAAALRNVHGSFYDFTAERMTRTASERLVEPPDEWGGRAIGAWARRLAGSNAFDPDIDQAARVAVALDRIYQACEF